MSLLGSIGMTRWVDATLLQLKLCHHLWRTQPRALDWWTCSITLWLWDLNWTPSWWGKHKGSMLPRHKVSLFCSWLWILSSPKESTMAAPSLFWGETLFTMRRGRCPWLVEVASFDLLGDMLNLELTGSHPPPEMPLLSTMSMFCIIIDICVLICITMCTYTWDHSIDMQYYVYVWHLFWFYFFLTMALFV